VTPAASGQSETQGECPRPVLKKIAGAEVSWDDKSRAQSRKRAGEGHFWGPGSPAAENGRPVGVDRSQQQARGDRQSSESAVTLPLAGAIERSVHPPC
jgi:hypothetical protein